MKRAELLQAAEQTVCKDRQATHGELAANFEAIASLWTTYIGKQVYAHDVAAMMALLKIARIKANPKHDDNWLDLAGYAACGSEVAP